MITLKNTSFIGVVLLLVLSLAGLQVSAQSGYDHARIAPRKALDKSRLECIYQHDIYDPDINWGNGCPEILQIGEEYIAYNNLGDYRVDSILGTMDTSTLTANQYQDIQRRFPQILLPFTVLTCIKAKTCVFATYFPFMGVYKYSEPLPEMAWRSEPGSKAIIGYECKKAACTFRGREWTVWYTPDIKAGQGPWKLHGLPGLILEAEDSTGQHHFTAIGIRKKPSTIYDGDLVSRSRVLMREEFNKRYSENNLTAAKGFWDAYYADPINNSKPAFKHFPNVPFELE